MLPFKTVKLVIIFINHKIKIECNGCEECPTCRMTDVLCLRCTDTTYKPKFGKCIKKCSAGKVVSLPLPSTSTD